MNIDFIYSDLRYKRIFDDFIIDKNKIMNFFGINELPFNIIIKVFDSRDEFYDYYNSKTSRTGADWLIGFAGKNNNSFEINVLAILEARKSNTHKYFNEGAFLKLLIHEFVHICHMSYKNYNEHFRFVNEGIAVYLSNQNNKLFSNEVNFTINDLRNKQLNYEWYRAIFDFMFDNYDLDFIMSILKSKDFTSDNLDMIYNDFSLNFKQKKMSK